MDKKPVVYCVFCHLTVAPYANRVSYSQDAVAHEGCFREALKKQHDFSERFHKGGEYEPKRRDTEG